LLSAFGTLIAAHQNNESRIKAEEALFRTQQQLKQMATKDPVTGIANRYLLVQELEAAYERRRADEDLSVLFIDVDHFKSVNDTHGHDLGDKVLKHLAQLLESAIRPNDIVGRYGGEEFLVGLPACSPVNAAVIAERMRAEVASSSFRVDEKSTLQLSISIGVSAMSQNPGNLEQLIHFADQSVYAAKEAGRNCVHVYGDTTAQQFH
jgi:diguanylate cyclase (GGDEF)-like protein